MPGFAEMSSFAMAVCYELPASGAQIERSNHVLSFDCSYRFVGILSQWSFILSRLHNLSGSENCGKPKAKKQGREEIKRGFRMIPRFVRN